MTPERNAELQLALISKRIKQKDLAVLVGIQPYAMTLIMRGVRVPKRDLADKIARTLDSTVEALWGRQVTQKGASSPTASTRASG